MNYVIGAYNTIPRGRLSFFRIIPAAYTVFLGAPCVFEEEGRSRTDGPSSYSETRAVRGILSGSSAHVR